VGEFDLDAGLPAKFERGHKLAELFAIEDHAVEDGAVFLVFIRCMDGYGRGVGFAGGNPVRCAAAERIWRSVY